MAIALLGWGPLARLGGDGTTPAAAHRRPASSAYAEPTPSQPSATSAGSIYRPTPLDGHWVSGRLSKAASREIAGSKPHERLTLLFRSTALAVWTGTRSEPEQRLVGYEAVWVGAHIVQLSRVGASHDRARYRWRIHGDRLRFRLLDTTAGTSASARLLTVPFARRVPS